MASHVNAAAGALAPARADGGQTATGVQTTARVDCAPLHDIVPLIDLLMQQKPVASGLWISTAPLPDWASVLGDAAGTWQCLLPAELLTFPFAQRFDLAVLDCSGPSSPKDKTAQPEAWLHGLTRLRDLLARQVLVVARPEHADRLRALGFGQFGQLEGWPVWQFNILAYKQVPDWLNARFWANPENFGKYRW